jgi:capsular exopolysaccharide synthesis family protein
MPAVLAQQRDVHRQIRAEIDRIIGNLRNALEVAEAREVALAQALDRVTGQFGIDNQVAVELRELERIAEANKVNYETFLSRARVAEDETTLLRSGAQVISAASLPETPSFPPRKIFVALGLIFGFGLGTIGAFLRQLLVGGFTAGAQIEDLLQLPVLTSLPRMKPRELKVDRQRVSLPHYVLKKPFSHYSEAIRALRSVIHLARVGTPCVVQIASAMPGEGKTTVAISLAHSSAQSGARVLLIDADFRRAAASRFFMMSKAKGLMDVVANPAETFGAIRKDERSGIFVLPAGPRSNRRPDILGSADTQTVLSAVRDRFDLVIVDSAPLGPVVDAALLAAYVDQVIWVVKWRSTPREAVIECLRRIDGGQKVVGVVLNMIEERRMPRYGRNSHFGATYFGSYYSP